MKKIVTILMLVGGLLTCYGRAQATLFYTNDFEGIVGSEWSNSSTDTTPVGNRNFLGQFSNQTVTLDLTALPSHNAITLSFDLFIIRTWDGNWDLWGPDIWDLSVVNGPTLLNTTFSSVTSISQAYPDAFSDGDNPGLTGATEIDTLGYTDLTFGIPRSSVYNLSFTFSHTASYLGLNFSASGLQQILDESWGIDNVQVTDVAPAPEPSTLLLLGFGLFGLVAYRKRQGSIERSLGSNLNY